MRAYRNILVSEHSRLDDLATERSQVIRRQLPVQMLVKVQNNVWREERLRTASSVGLLRPLLCSHVGESESLLRGSVRIGGEVLTHRPFDVSGQCLLTLNAVGVVRVHRPQQRTHRATHARVREARELPGGLLDIVSQLPKAAEHAVFGDKRLEITNSRLNHGSHNGRSDGAQSTLVTTYYLYRLYRLREMVADCLADSLADCLALPILIIPAAFAPARGAA